MSSEDRRPDWDYGKNVPEWTILEAVTLSMDIDPNKLHYKSHHKPPGMIGRVEVRDESPEFEKRISLAIRNQIQLAGGVAIWAILSIAR